MAASPSAPSPANGTTATGTRCAPAPVISMESCARAPPAPSARRSRSNVRKTDCKRAILLVLFSRLFVLRPEAKFQLALEEAGLVGLGQGRGLKDSALHGLVV